MILITPTYTVLAQCSLSQLVAMVPSTQSINHCIRALHPPFLNSYIHFTSMFESYTSKICLVCLFFSIILATTQVRPPQLSNVSNHKKFIPEQ